MPAYPPLDGSMQRQTQNHGRCRAQFLTAFALYQSSQAGTCLDVGLVSTGRKRPARPRPLNLPATARAGRSHARQRSRRAGGRCAARPCAPCCRRDTGTCRTNPAAREAPARVCRGGRILLQTGRGLCVVGALGPPGPLRPSPGRWLRVQHRSAGRRVRPGVVLVVAVAQRDPDRAVALEAAAEGELPHAIAAPHALLRLHIAPRVPGRRQGRLGHDRRIGLHARRMRPRAVHGGTPGGSRPELMRACPALCLGKVQAALP